MCVFCFSDNSNDIPGGRVRSGAGIRFGIQFKIMIMPLSQLEVRNHLILE